MAMRCITGLAALHKDGARYFFDVAKSLNPMLIEHDRRTNHAACYA